MGTEIELPVESCRLHKPTISTHREKADSESRCGWVEIETHGFSRPSHAAIDFRGFGPLTRNSPNGFVHHTLYAHSTETAALPYTQVTAQRGLFKLWKKIKCRLELRNHT